jgi:hypothetical protein
MAQRKVRYWTFRAVLNLVQAKTLLSKKII